MVRPRKVNKEAMTTAAVPEKLIKDLNLTRPANKSIGDFLNQIFQEWKTRKAVEESYNNLRDENKFLVETIDQNQRKIQEYIEVIEVLKKDKEMLDKKIELV